MLLHLPIVVMATVSPVEHVPALGQHPVRDARDVGGYQFLGSLVPEEATVDDHENRLPRSHPAHI